MTIEIDFAGTAVTLLHERALIHSASGSLLIADLHLGKADSMRMSGTATPRGAARSDLNRLSHLIDRYTPSSVWILGDMIHGPITGTFWRQEWSRFRNSYPTLDIHVVTGNHDRRLDPEELQIQRFTEPAFHAGIWLYHHPHIAEASLVSSHERWVIAGHLHPMCRVPGIKSRYHTFVVSDKAIILPAFSEFAGGYLVSPNLGRLYICGPDAMHQLAPRN